KPGSDDSPLEPGHSTKAGGLPDMTDSETLSAQRAIERLIQDLHLDAPPLTRDPLSFLADSLKASLVETGTGETGGDIYSIKQLIERIERASEREREAEGAVLPSRDSEATAPPQTEAGELLEGIRDALRRSQFREMVVAGRAIPKSSLSVEQLSELMRMMGQ